METKNLKKGVRFFFFFNRCQAAVVLFKKKKIYIISYVKRVQFAAMQTTPTDN